MKHNLINILSSLVYEPEWFENIYWGNDSNDPPMYCYQVNFSRLEITLKGNYINQTEQINRQGSQSILMRMGEALFLPPNSWNKPIWDDDCVVLALLFGKRQIGFSLLGRSKKCNDFYDVQKFSLKINSSEVIDSIVNSLNGLALSSQQVDLSKYTAKMLIKGLLNHILTILINFEFDKKHDLFHLICIYVQENFYKDITRKNIAAHFNISENHVSRIFKKNGNSSFSDFLISVRVDRAKFMLRKYDFRLSEIAVRCGFNDPNYFFRVFKRHTGTTPKAYRVVNSTI